jgi:anti-sigma factor RsiW
MTAPRRRFEVIAPDWGQAHLTSDAIVAFVDDELTPGAQLRAARHLEACPECVAEVTAQGQARSALRSAQCPTLPSSLLRTLRSIPRDTDLPAPPPGLAMDADGQLVHTTRAAAPVRRPPGQRWLRFGAGVAVSGLALGALTLGVLSVLAADRGVFGGSLLGGSADHVLDAQLHLAPAGSPAPSPAASPVEPLLERLDRMPASCVAPGWP